MSRSLNLAALTLPRLRRLLVTTGYPVSGTKTQLLARLEMHFPVLGRSDRGGAGADDGKGRKDGGMVGVRKKGGLQEKRIRNERILSIDMGIQNLAFCVVDVSYPTVAGTKNGVRRETESREEGTGMGEMEVVAWQRVMPLSYLSSPSSSTSSISSISESKSKSGSSSSSLSKSPSPKPYTAPTLALAAHHLLTQTLLRYNPTTILIEQQRFRTNGVAAVQEWTLRVNTLEAAIWGVLAGMRGGSGWESNGEGRGDVAREERVCPAVYAVSPAQVTAFWEGVLAEEDGSFVDGDGGGEGEGMLIRRGKRKSVSGGVDGSGGGGFMSHGVVSDGRVTCSDSDNDSGNDSNNDFTGDDDPSHSKLTSKSKYKSKATSKTLHDSTKLKDKRAKVALVRRWITQQFTTSYTTPNTSSSMAGREGIKLSFAAGALEARDVLLKGRKALRGRGRKDRKSVGVDGGGGGSSTSTGSIGNSSDDNGDSDDSRTDESDGDVFSGAFTARATNRDGSLSSPSSSTSSTSSSTISSTSSTTSTGKTDDLADCLLQATAWTRWQMNRNAVRRGELARLL